jgi:hypothetical protein
MRRKKRRGKLRTQSQFEPSADTSLSNEKEVSTEAPSFIIIPLETHHEPKALVIQFLKEPSYAKGKP